MLEQLDQKLFLFINGHHSPIWDNLMFAISGKLIWAPLYIAILVFLVFKFRRKFWILALFLGLSIALSDMISVHFFKNVFCRLRPCHEPHLEGLVHLVGDSCGGLYGFVSSHASNSFNVAVLTLLLIRKKWYSVAILIWAIVIGYSRVYLGVHYPGDVICGSLLGILTGWSVFQLYRITDNKVLSVHGYFENR